MGCTGLDKYTSICRHLFLKKAASAKGSEIKIGGGGDPLDTTIFSGFQTGIPQFFFSRAHPSVRFRSVGALAWGGSKQSAAKGVDPGWTARNTPAGNGDTTPFVQWNRLRTWGHVYFDYIMYVSICSVLSLLLL